LFEKMNVKVAPYWVEGPWSGRLAIVPRPRGGDWLEDDVRFWQQSGLDVIVSLLTQKEIEEFDLVQEAALCKNYGLFFVSFPIPDRSVPSSHKLTGELVQTLTTLLDEGKNVGIHCRQGIGRSAIIAACLLITSGVTPELAFLHVSSARGCSVPETPEQQQWVSSFSEYESATRAESPHGRSAVK